MCLKLLLLMVLINRLEAVQNQTNASSSNTNENCSLVEKWKAEAYRDGFIRLNISWSGVRTQQLLSIRIHPKLPSSCHYRTSENINATDSHFLIAPPPRILEYPEYEIYPSCVYDITMAAEDAECRLEYTIPECVGKEDCFCHRMYAEDPKILNITQFQDFYLVLWDSGRSTDPNINYTITEVQFFYGQPPPSLRFRLHLNDSNTNLSGKFSKIPLADLRVGQEYVVYATFINNHNCSSKFNFTFTVSENCHMVSDFTVRALAHNPMLVNISWTESRVHEATFQITAEANTITHRVDFIKTADFLVMPLPNSANCLYEITMKSSESCSILYNPEKCDGDMCDNIYTVEPRIVSMVEVDGGYNVTWNGGQSELGNVTITNATFVFRRDGVIDIDAPVVKTNLNASLISLDDELVDAKYLLHGVLVNQYNCPYPSDFQLCPLVSDLSVMAFLDGPIRLNISWTTAKIPDPVNIEVIAKDKEKCLYTTTEPNYSLNTSLLITPPLSITHPEYEIEPNCWYEIKMTSAQLECLVIYQIPDCVDTKCDCDLIYRFEPKILSVSRLWDDCYLVEWQPGDRTAFNRTYQITNVRFLYGRSGASLSEEKPLSVTTNITAGYSEITFYKLHEFEEYKLHAEFSNNYGCRRVVTFNFTAAGKSSNYLLVFFLLLGLIIVIIVSYKLFVKYGKKFVRVLPRRSEPQVFTLSPIRNGHVPMQRNLQYAPVECLMEKVDAYEFPRDMIVLKEEIGSGAFGKVYSAKAMNIDGSDGYKMVAVKTLSESEAMEDFRAEIEILKKIGVHPNIVRLLGCCTIEAPYMMIMEFVPCGDLKNYLVELREQWTKRKNHRVFFPDSSDGVYIEPTSPQSQTSVTSSRLPSTSETVCTNISDPLTPILSQYNQSLEKVLDHTELQQFALQIAKGMAHLERIPVTHRDLAARNILINEYKVLKISDFGLSRKGPYINQKLKRLRLPLRWMAPEAILQQHYDSKSDVWSFGVVLWEIATLGAFPYDNVMDSALVQFLQMGRRLDRPQICTDELYLIMMQCWSKKPELRPTFRQLVDLLDVEKKRVYVDFGHLNPTYVFPPSDIHSKSD